MNTNTRGHHHNTFPLGEREGEEGILDYLTLQGTSSTSTVWGNPGGWIMWVSCSQLVLLQPDSEGGKDELLKFYQRIGPDDVSWWDLNHKS